MLRLRVVQAAYGDCLILEHGTEAKPRHILIDGGPSRQNYLDHLRPELDAIRASGGKIDLCVLSHVDDDHVNGLNQLFSELREQRAERETPLIGLRRLWHNSFSAQSPRAAEITRRLEVALARANSASQVALAALSRELTSIRNGNKLKLLAGTDELNVSINQGFQQGAQNPLIRVDDAPVKRRHGLTIRIVGPTQANLDALELSWREWLDENEDRLNQLQAIDDDSIPNMSSIMLLVEGDGRRMLLTGDGRGDHLLDGLRMARQLDENGRIWVDVLKVPHHGSNHNVDKAFFETVRADTYVISGDGSARNGTNPDLDTLKWIVEVATADQRPIEIVVTNETEEVRALRAEMPQEENTYTLRVLDPDRHSIVVDFASADGRPIVQGARARPADRERGRSRPPKLGLAVFSVVGNWLAARLAEEEITSLQAIRDRLSEEEMRRRLADEMLVSKERLDEIHRFAWLANLTSVGETYAELLYQAGIGSVRTLQDQSGPALTGRLNQAIALTGSDAAPPTAQEANAWILQARSIGIIEPAGREVPVPPRA